tara:strand:- start:492 stop:737 length:246 start_codon:yes stop_codon:yes gene_type:complete
MHDIKNELPLFNKESEHYVPLAELVDHTGYSLYTLDKVRRGERKPSDNLIKMVVYSLRFKRPGKLYTAGDLFGEAYAHVLD